VLSDERDAALRQFLRVSLPCDWSMQLTSIHGFIAASFSLPSRLWIRSSLFS
jgi:hypothetical protein